MELGPLWRGLVVGFSIAAPVGPIGLLCIRRTLAEGQLTGLASGLGAATADSLYGCVAAFGLAFVSGALLGIQSWLRLGGGLFLCYLGLRTLLARPANAEPRVRSHWTGPLGAYSSTLFLTLTNPMTIISYTAVLAGAGVGTAATGYGPAILLVAGVFLGSACWWLLLSGGVSLLRGRIGPTTLIWVNRLAGAAILGFGVYTAL